MNSSKLRNKPRRFTSLRILKTSLWGLTISELLISMGLGVTLMAGVSQVFVGMRQTEHAQEAASRIQETGRFALNFLAQEIRTSGYLGCSSTLSDLNNILVAASTPASFQPTTGIQGWEATGTGVGSDIPSTQNVAVETVTNTSSDWSTSGGNTLDNTTVVPDSDIIKVWTVDTESQGILNTITTGSPIVLNVTSMDIDNGDVLLMSDCSFADIVQVCSSANVAGTPPTMNLTVGTTCTPGNVVASGITSDIGAEVFKIEATMFYIGKRNDNANNPPALFRRTLGANASINAAEELVEGVENMQILYGENTDADNLNTADRYVTANQVTDWADVVSVRISLLVQSLDTGITGDPQAYTFNGLTYDGETGNGDLPGDTRIRRVFTTTINLRNRALGQ